MDYFKESLALHKRLRGKIRMQPKIDVRNKDDLSLVYSPGVAEPCREIYKDVNKVWDYTIKSNTVAIVTNGTAVLGLGDIGPYAAIPVMEGKAMLFKRFGNIDAFPICLNTKDPDEVIKTVKLLEPVFGGINLEDISAPASFYIEEQLQDIGIPVFHDDQHGTAIVVLGGLINAAKLAGKRLDELEVVVNGAGAAGVAIAKLLRCVNDKDNEACIPVKDIRVCDSKGIIHSGREDLNESKKDLLRFTNNGDRAGSVHDALDGADVFIGVSVGDILDASDVKRMNDKPIVFALANPNPEISPSEAEKGGAFIYGTGRSDLPNQVNNVLGFPGIFRGALDAHARRISPAMKLAASHAIAESIREPQIDRIIPPSINEEVAYRVARAVYAVAKEENA